ncbi:MAG: Hpt domain-containing protein [Eudoraea sp.]|nr:Hpt domain-containing protein [Eudoraea sp.]
MKEIPNLSYINELSKGDASFTNDIIAIIKKELFEEVSNYRQHLKKENFTKTAGYVHKICHKIRILGLEKGYKIAEKYNSDLLDSNLKLKTEFENILSAMLQFIKKA